MTTLDWFAIDRPQPYVGMRYGYYYTLNGLPGRKETILKVGHSVDPYNSRGRYLSGLRLGKFDSSPIRAFAFPKSVLSPRRLETEALKQLRAKGFKRAGITYKRADRDNDLALARELLSGPSGLVANSTAWHEAVREAWTLAVLGGTTTLPVAG